MTTTTQERGRIVVTEDGHASCTVHGWPDVKLREIDGRKGDRNVCDICGASRWIVP
jgi:hypothetical protein